MIYDLHSMMKSFSAARVLVAGDVMLDVYDFCYSEQSRPSPEKTGARVYTAHRTRRILGGAGNVAANLASLGVQTGLISVCGNDGAGLDVKRLCDEAGIVCELVRDESRPTPVKTRLYIDDQYHLRRDDEKTHRIRREISKAVYDAFDRHLERTDAVILSDYGKGLFTEEGAQALIRLCTEKKIPVIVDVKPANRSCFRGATVVIPNRIEAETLVPGFSADDPQPGLSALYDLLGAANIAVTLGAQGVLTYDGSRWHRIKGRNVPVVDPCGCGDTVRAGLTLGLIHGLSLQDAAEFANYVASLAVQKLGTAVLTPDELIKGL